MNFWSSFRLDFLRGRGQSEHLQFGHTSDELSHSFKQDSWKQCLTLGEHGRPIIRCYISKASKQIVQD